MGFEDRVAELLLGLPVVKLRLADAVSVFSKRGVTSLTALEELNGPDLLLAHAALLHQSAALKEVDRRIVAVCQRVKRARLDLDDLVQLVRARVLVGPPPRLETYSGRGALSVWLRAVALTTLSHATRSKRDQETDDDAGDEVLALVSSSRSPELSAIDRRRSAVLISALERALKAFTADERTMLRLRFVNGLAFEEVARIFGLHRTTAMRTLERCHQQLVARFHLELEADEISKSEFDSLSRLFEGSFVMHLQRVLTEEK